MNAENYKNMVQEKVVGWENQLAILQDDATRETGGGEAENQDTMRELYRQFEVIASRLDEIEGMSAEDFQEEKQVMDELISDFEAQLAQAREEVADV